MAQHRLLLLGAGRKKPADLGGPAGSCAYSRSWAGGRRPKGSDNDFVAIVETGIAGQLYEDNVIGKVGLGSAGSHRNQNGQGREVGAARVSVRIHIDLGVAGSIVGQAYET